MATTLSDTDPGTERMFVQIMRETPVWRRLELVAEMNATVLLLGLNGLRQLYPHASPMELRRRMADILLGPELATRAYGPLASTKAPAP